MLVRRLDFEGDLRAGTRNRQRGERLAGALSRAGRSGTNLDKGVERQDPALRKVFVREEGDLEDANFDARASGKEGVAAAVHVGHAASVRTTIQHGS